MAESSDRITFNCTSCGHPVVIDKDNPPNDDDILSCHGCGKEFGPYAKVDEAAIAMAKAKLNKLVEDTLGEFAASL